MADKVYKPTPQDLFGGRRRPEPLAATVRLPAPDETRSAVPQLWDREVYETGLRHSGLHPFARLLGFILAHYAAHSGGYISAEKVPEAELLVRASGMRSTSVRHSLQSLEARGWVTRAAHSSVARPHVSSITLTVPVDVALPPSAGSGAPPLRPNRRPWRTDPHHPEPQR